MAVYIDSIFLSNPYHSIPILKSNFALYEKFFVHGVKLEFVPTQPVTVGGSVAMAPDYDPLDPMPASRAVLSSSQGYKTSPVTSRLICDMPNYKGPSGAYIRPDLFCAPSNDDRLTCFGQFKCFAEAASLSKGDIAGRLVLHYDISFHILEPLGETHYGASSLKRLTSAGTATVWSPTLIRSTTVSDGLKFQSSTGTDVLKAVDTVTSAIVDTVSSQMPMTTVAGKIVNPGTRIYVRPVVGDISTTTYTAETSSEFCGGIGLSKTFDELSNIVMPLSNAVYNTVKDSMYIS